MAKRFKLNSIPEPLLEKLDRIIDSNNTAPIENNTDKTFTSEFEQELSNYQTRFKITKQIFEENKWYKLIPNTMIPYTNKSMVIWYRDADIIEITLCFTFVQHYINNKYLLKEEKTIMDCGYSFMILNPEKE